MDIAVEFNVADYFPLLNTVDPQRLRPKARAAYGCLEELCDKFINQRLQHRASNLATHGDLLDSFLDFSQENESDFNLKHIQVLLVSQCQPQRGRIEESEILQLPYLQAVVEETMWLHLVVPFLIPHKSNRDVDLGHYLIPKNTQVLVNAWAIARDPNYWKNPTCFIPDRFIGSDLDFKGQHFSFIPFGLGRRMCPGIPLAHRVESLMIATLVYHFEWKLPHGAEAQKLDMNQSFGLTLQKAVPLLAVPVTLNNDGTT